MRQLEIQKTLLKNFPFSPTADQQLLIGKVAEYFCDATSRKCFVLKGYAGTGKTSFIRSLVKTLPQIGLSYSLLAPTGRAAKVISEYTSVQAYTIHKAIYEIIPSKGGSLSVKLADNKTENKIFIVDEASMISSGDDRSLLKGRSLLRDLFSHVYATKGCSLIFIGDTAQLPPVGEVNSSALDAKHLSDYFDVEVQACELKEVVRQAEDSGILMNATALRILIGKSAGEPILKSVGFKDVEQINGETLRDNLEEFYASSNSNDTLIVCRSNKQANKYNEFIRNHLLSYEDQVNSGDRMMVVKNNYYWLESDSATGFIANGDILKVKRILSYEKKFGFNFANATVVLADYPGEGEYEVKLLLDTIKSEAPSLTQEDQKKLFEEVYKSFEEELKGPKRLRKTYADPYYNALQVKFSYAVTCHKAQGGQWQNVFVDSGYMNESMFNTEYLRWLYTAITRATKKLLFVNFDERFFKK